VRSHEFTDLQKLYEERSPLWLVLVKHVDPEELKGGAFAKMLHLSRNPRLAAILMT
jgi:hypothetical protein